MYSNRPIRYSSNDLTKRFCPHITCSKYTVYIGSRGFIGYNISAAVQFQNALKKGSCRVSADTDTMMLSGWQFLFGGAVMTVIGLLTGGNISIPGNQKKFLILCIVSNVWRKLRERHGLLL